MIAKLIVRGTNREDAIRKVRRALKEFHISGVHSTIPFHQYMMEDKRYLTGDYTLEYVDSLIAAGCKFEPMKS